MQDIDPADLGADAAPDVDERSVDDLAGAMVTPLEASAPRPKTHERAGITKNHNRGESKQRRKTAAASRRRNRRGKA